MSLPTRRVSSIDGPLWGVRSGSRGRCSLLGSGEGAHFGWGVPRPRGRLGTLGGFGARAPRYVVADHPKGMMRDHPGWAEVWTRSGL